MAEHDSYFAVRNDEEQYSIWPTSMPLPAGWYEAGASGSRADCLSFIETAWTDMRPRSLREFMADRQ